MELPSVSKTKIFPYTEFFFVYKKTYLKKIKAPSLRLYLVVQKIKSSFPTPSFSALPEKWILKTVLLPPSFSTLTKYLKYKVSSLHLFLSHCNTKNTILIYIKKSQSPHLFVKSIEQEINLVWPYSLSVITYVSVITPLSVITAL
jgi:hypothetical protein